MNIILLIFHLFLLTSLKEVKGLGMTYGGLLKTLEYPERLIFDFTEPLHDAVLKHKDSSFIREVTLDQTGVRLSPIMYYRRDYNTIVRNATRQWLGLDPLHEAIQEMYIIRPKTICFLFGAQSRHNQLVGSTLPLTPESTESILNNTGANKDKHFTVIFIVRLLSPMFSDVKKLQNMIAGLKYSWKNIKVGLEFANEQRFHKEESLLPLIHLVDTLIIGINIPYESFILSYSKFKANLKSMIEANYAFIQSANPHCNVFVKINVIWKSQPEVGIRMTKELYQKYYYYLLQFAIFWVNDGEEIGIILESFNNSLAYQEDVNGAGLRDVLSANLNAYILLNDVCRIRGIMEYISPNLNAVSVEEKLWDKFRKMDKCALTSYRGELCGKPDMEREVCNRPIVNSSIPDITLRLKMPVPRHNLHNFSNTLISIAKSLRGIPWTVIEFDYISPMSYEDFYDIGYNEEGSDYDNSDVDQPNNQTLVEYEEDDYDNDNENEEAVESWSDTDAEFDGTDCDDGSFYLLNNDTLANLQLGYRELPPGVNSGCRITTDNPCSSMHVPADKDNFVQMVYDKCSFMWNQSDIIAWDYNFMDISDLQNLTIHLMEIEGRRQQFLQLFPEKSVMLHIYLQGEGYVQPPFEVFGVYCRPDVLILNGKVEVVTNFARIHNIPLKVKDVLDYGDHFGWWREVKTIPELYLAKDHLPVLIARDYPEKFLSGDFHTEPCISWTDVVPTGGITVDSHHSGATVYMKLSKNISVTPEEFENMLRFALHKFPLIELIPGSVTDIQTVFRVLSTPGLLKKLVAQESTEHEIYLRIDVRFFNKSDTEVEEFFNKLVLKPIGIHFIYGGNSTLDIKPSLVGQLQLLGIKLGVWLDDCVDEVNNHFGNFKHSQLYKQTDYLVCNVKESTEATNTHKPTMETFLDTHYYIQKFFQRIFLGDSKEMLFHLNTVPVRTVAEENRRVADFLKFFSDVNQYASVNKMKFFMFPAFDDVTENRFGWWRISSYDDLTNASVFIEKEAEYLGNESWRPPTESPEEVETEPNYSAYIIGSLVALLVILLGLTMFSRIWSQRRFTRLSKEEADGFLQGTFLDGPDGGTTFDSKQFPQEFEIDRNRFLLLGIIGKGNFGVVYKATFFLDGDEDGATDTVAVKIPHPGCSKESFLSILSEVKLLCYVGTHPNVLKFVGAYIKEIRRGVAYVVTELCENGALQEHLRKILVALDGKEQILSLNLYELYRFAHEIALGMEHIASQKIIHGDLSTRNVLLDFNMHCKIGDFGLSRKLYGYEEYVKKKGGPLPWRWMAIESLQRMEFTTKSDIWSYGVTLWEIFSLGKVPYPGLSWSESFLEGLENGVRMSVPAFSTNAIYEQMRNCWDGNPASRPSFNELAQFFVSIRNVEYTEM